MSDRPLRVATRGSKLALWQTNHVASLLGLDVQPVIIQTRGDMHRDVPIDAIRGQAIFVKEVEAAVLDGRADFAVHSAKDLPSDTAEGLALAAVPERADPRDALVGSSLDELPSGATVATGSVRRRAQLAALRPDLTFADLRGNVDTRLEKAKSFGAIAVAYAALVRLGRTEVDAHVMHPRLMVPQVGQGALAVECRGDDKRTIEMLRVIEHADSRRAVDAERAFLSELGGGCDLPAAGYATVEGGVVFMRAMLSSLDGRIVLRRHGTAADPVTLGRELAVELLEKAGGSGVLFDHRRSA